MGSVQNTLFCGYLFKKSPTGTWQKRYCLAFKNKLVYYKHKARVEKGSPQGTVSFIDCVCVLPDDGDIHSHRREHCFILRSSSTREFYWAAESRSEVDKWYTILNVCIREVLASKSKIGPHCLKKVHFSRPTICAKCSALISGIGKQGFMCKVCLLCIHKKCENKLGDYCLKLKTDYQPSPTPNKSRLSQQPQSAGLDLQQLNQAMIEYENEEKILIQTVTSKYDHQANEIIDEIYFKYQNEVLAIEEDANNKKREILKEIRLRESQLLCI